MQIHHVQEYFRGTKRQFIIADVKQTSTSSNDTQSSRTAGFKRNQPTSGHNASDYPTKVIKAVNTTKPCPTCGNFHVKDAKKSFADGRCKFLGHPDVNKESQPNATRVPWQDSTQGKRYAATAKTGLVWGVDIAGTAVEMLEINLQTASAQ